MRLVQRFRLWVWNLVVNGVLAGSACPRRLRAAVLRLTSAHIGRGVVISRHVDFYGPKLSIGDRVFLNAGTHILNYAHVTIGDDVQVGPRVMILTVGHRLGGPEKRAVGLVAEPVEIGAGTWLAAGVTIAPGVTVGRGCVVGAGAVVLDDCEPNGLYVGTPARRVRDLDV